MAERKATNKYYPPDWDPSKGSLNKHVGQHPLRDRARKLSEGILIIRFELPFNIWCLGCERHLARGVRFNAEKKEIGKYYSTPILSFRMKCPSCSNWIEICTDPKNSEYQVTAGARKKNEEYSAEEAGIGGTRLTEEESAQLESNPFFKLEHEARDLRKAKEVLPRLQGLQKAKDSVSKDDWEASKRVRAVFRQQKREIERERGIEEEALKKSGGIVLVPEHEDDKAAAKEIDFSTEAKRKASLRKSATEGLKSLEEDSSSRKLKQLIKTKSTMGNVQNLNEKQ